MKFYPILDQNKLSEFPTESHNNEVEILFPGDKPKNDDYIITSIIDVINLEKETFDELLDRIHRRAKDNGVDAVILLDEEQIKRVRKNKEPATDLLELSSKADTSNIFNTENLGGIGIKYRKNVDYLEKYVKSKDIYINTSSKEDFKLNGSIFVDFDGNDARRVTKRRQGMLHYEKFMKAYSYQFLILEKKDFWSYKTNARGEVVKRILVNEEGFPELKCTIEYDDNNRVALIAIKRMSHSFSSKHEIVEFFYDEKGKIIEQTILTLSNEELRIYYDYDYSGKLKESVLQRMKGTREVPFIKVVYNYYSNKDINQF